MRAAFAPVLLCGALLGACSAPPTVLTGITVLADTDANNNSPTALDLVFVYDTASASLLPKNGPEWFDKRQALIAGLATAIDVVSLQPVPASSAPVTLPPRYAKAIAVYSYANYIAPAGQPMGNLTPYLSMTIRLSKDSVLYQGRAPH
jgi:type VI secretion system protein